MRTHRVFAALQPWAWRTDWLRDLVTGERLVAARLEPVTRGREPAVFLDLHFSDGERSITVPLVYVDLAQLDVREADPLLFPHDIAPAVIDAHACEIVDRVLPDLERRARGGGFWHEEVLLYGVAPVFAAARERGFFGAAPLATALPRIAPAVYARRFAVGKAAAAYGPGALELAAFLRGVTTSCTVVGDDADAAAWYGALEPADITRSYDVAIGTGAAPVRAATTVRVDAADGGFVVAAAAALPADVMLAFDHGAGPAARQFTIVTTREPFARALPPLDIAPPAGGSSGRIAVVVRPDAAAVPDADTDEAAALAAALGGEGFTVAVVAGIDALAAFAPDLVHLIGTRPGGYARRVAEWAAEHRKPFAVHALHEAPDGGGYWGAMVSPYCFNYSGDDRSVSMFLESLARRAVEVDGVGPAVRYAPPIAGLDDTERVLSLADVVFVNSERELAAVEPLRKRRPTFIVAPVPRAGSASEPIGAQVGSDPFILVHAPIGPESNQLMLARAGAAVGVPMVMAGPIEDPAYAERLREFAPSQLRLIDEPAPAAAHALYRSASVVADAAWIARGHSRLLGAAAAGAAVVCSQSRWLDLPAADRWSVDPADVQSIARGLGEAWDGAVARDPAIGRAAAFARGRFETAAGAIVATYARIAQAV